MATDTYLQARPAEYDLDPHLKSRAGRPKPGADGYLEPKGTFDSGVADLEMHRMSSASARPKSSAMYEYIDSDGHYEDVPGTLGRSVSGLPNGGPDGRQSTISDCRSVVTDVTSDTDDTATIFKTPIDKKKRYNPLYEPSSSSTPNVFARKKQQHVEQLERHIRIQCAFLLLISIVAIAALCLSLYLVFFQVLDQNNSMIARIKDVEKKSQEISQENEQLKLIVTAAGFNTSLLSSPLIKTLTNTSETVLSFEDQLDLLTNQVTFTTQNLSQTISDLQSTFNQQLLNISKMPGPPGVGNLSACTYENFTSAKLIEGSETPASTTSFKPDIAELQEKVVMFAACGVTGGTSYSLETNVITPNMVQYRCRCHGQTTSVDRFCTIHFMFCPRETKYSADAT